MVIQSTFTADALILAGMAIRAERFILKVPTGGITLRATYMMRRCVIGDIIGYIGYGEEVSLHVGQVIEENWTVNPITGLAGHKYTVLTIPRFNETHGHTEFTFYARVFCIFKILTQEELKALNE